MFNLINNKERTSNTTNCLIRHELMPPDHQFTFKISESGLPCTHNSVNRLMSYYSPSCLFSTSIYHSHQLYLRKLFLILKQILLVNLSIVYPFYTIFLFYWMGLNKCTAHAHQRNNIFNKIGFFYYSLVATIVYWQTRLGYLG